MLKLCIYQPQHIIEIWIRSYTDLTLSDFFSLCSSQVTWKDIHGLPLPAGEEVEHQPLHSQIGHPFKRSSYTHAFEIISIEKTTNITSLLSIFTQWIFSWGHHHAMSALETSRIQMHLTPEILNNLQNSIEHSKGTFVEDDDFPNFPFGWDMLAHSPGKQPQVRLFQFRPTLGTGKSVWSKVFQQLQP